MNETANQRQDRPKTPAGQVYDPENPKYHSKRNDMPIIHFLNVLEGDCSIIQHMSGHVTMIDVCNAESVTPLAKSTGLAGLYLQESAKVNFKQKDDPVNPIEYMKERNINSIFRFILSHPDMDHMDGIEAVYSAFKFPNFWDTANTKEKPSFSAGRYKEADWDFYQSIRDGKNGDTPKRLVIYAGENRKYFNLNDKGEAGGDGLYILAPTKELIKQGNKNDDFNVSSYVILYKTHNRKILFGGDSDDDTWEHLIDNHYDDVADVDVLIAPHHGRKSGISYEHLKVVNPKLTLFGNAKSRHLNYADWNKLGLYKITNNEGNCVIMDVKPDGVNVYVTNDEFAKQESQNTHYNEEFKGWYLGSIR